MPGAQGHITVRRRSKNGKDAEPTVTLVPSVPTVNVPLGSDGYVDSAANDFDVRVVMKVGLANISTFTSLAVSKITGGVYGFYPTEPIPSTGTVKFHLSWDDKVTQLGVLTNIFQVTGTAQYKGKTYTETCDICVCFVVAGSSTTGPQGNAYTIDGPELIRYNEKTGTAAPETVTWTARNNGSAVNTTLRAIYNGSQISTFTSGGEFGVVDFLDQEAPGLKSGGTFTLQMLVNNAVVATKTVVVERVREIVFRGPQVWQSGRVYYGGEWDAEANLFVVDITTQKVSGTWYYFYCKKKNSNNTTLSPWDDTQGGSRGGTYWVRAEKIPFVATELLLADGAVIDWLQGRTMTLTNRNSNVVGGLTGDLEDNINTLLWLGASYTNRGNAPFRVTSDGELTSSKANITGKLTAKGINLSQHIIDTTASVAVTEPGTYIADIAKTGNQMDLTLDPSDFEEGDIVTICHPVKDGQDYFISIHRGSAEFYQGILVGYNNSSFDQDAGYDATVFQPSGAGGVYLEVSGDLYGVGGIFPCKTASGYGLLSYYPSNTYMKGQSYYTRCYFSGGTVELMVVRNDINEKVFYVKSRQAMYWQTTCNVSASGLYPMYSTLIETCGRAIAFYTSNNTWAW